MTARTIRALCWVALVCTLVGLAARALLELPRAVADSPSLWLERVAFWVGVVGPQLAFLFSQTQPDARRVVPLWGQRDDGWLIVLFVSQVVAFVPVMLGDGSRGLTNVANLAIGACSVLLLVLRVWQLRMASAARE